MIGVCHITAQNNHGNDNLVSESTMYSNVRNPGEPQHLLWVLGMRRNDVRHDWLMTMTSLHQQKRTRFHQQTSQVRRYLPHVCKYKATNTQSVLQIPARNYLVACI